MFMKYIRDLRIFQIIVFIIIYMSENPETLIDVLQFL